MSNNAKKILIAEDEKPLANALELKISKEGFEVVRANNGRDALNLLLRGDISVAILDLIMPQMDGFGVLASLQEEKTKTKIIILSNLAQNEDVIRAKKLGALEYFVKSDTSISSIVEEIKKLAK